jgi:uncharacterized LabA/DUF88 family protein
MPKSKYARKVQTRPPKPAKVPAPKAAVPVVRTGTAPPHAPLANGRVHVFVDDQNLFYGIVNQHRGPGYRFDFGRLLLAAARDLDGNARGVGTAYVAGVIPDDDSFWQIATAIGFTVRRGYLGSQNRSKQDDAYLITDMVATLYEAQGPSTIVLVAGDADYMPPLKKAIEKGWRVEVLFVSTGLSVALEPVAHELRRLSPGDIELYRDLP